jgi:hypothetical protein
VRIRRVLVVLVAGGVGIDEIDTSVASLGSRSFGGIQVLWSDRAAGAVWWLLAVCSLSLRARSGDGRDARGMHSRCADKAHTRMGIVCCDANPEHECSTDAKRDDERKGDERERGCDRNSQKSCKRQEGFKTCHVMEE